MQWMSESPLRATEMKHCPELLCKRDDFEGVHHDLIDSCFTKVFLVTE